MSRIRLAAAVAALALAPAAAQAGDIFNAANYDRLCTVSAPPQRLVDRDALASLIADRAEAEPYLDGANAAGNSNGAIETRSTGAVPSEPLYAVSHAGLTDAPFGPNVDPKAAGPKKVIEKIVGYLTEDVMDLLRRGETADGGVTYRSLNRVTRQPDHVGFEAFTGRDFFQAQGRFEIACEEDSKADAKDEEDKNKAVVFLLRATPADLGSPEAAEDLDPASVGYEANEVKGDATFKFKAAAGLRFKLDANTRLIPFVAYERQTIKKDADIDKLAEGLLLSYAHEYDSAVWHARLEVTHIADLEQDAKQAKLRAYFDPVIELAGAKLFGGDLLQDRPVKVRPELTVIGDASTVIKPGRSEALANAETYFGLGGDVSVKFKAGDGVPSPWSQLSLNVGVRGLQLTGEIGQDWVARRYGKLEYAPKDSPWGLALSFSEGNNDDTLQREDTVGLELTLRY